MSAAVAELADAHDSKSCEVLLISVRPRSAAPSAKGWWGMSYNSISEFLVGRVWRSWLAYAWLRPSISSGRRQKKDERKAHLFFFSSASWRMLELVYRFPLGLTHFVCSGQASHPWLRQQEKTTNFRWCFFLGSGGGIRTHDQLITFCPLVS